ncbi:DUF551 domain-containing protein [Yersinia enterocolitica]
MKELDGFTVEQLNDFIKSDHTQCGDVAALARIALAAKRAEPVAYITYNGYLIHAGDPKLSEYSDPQPLYDTPQLNSQVPLGSWIKCSDQMPENDEFVRIWPLPDFGVELHVGQYIKFHKNGPGWFAQVYEHNYGVEFYPITVTHWMPLPAAPESE